ncbi:hypothetical protein DVT68_18420 [Dyella solisilvae]|uniref:Uncharacterized protein n=1 Tax=Dyella solisilvae TaxID=1920168 RepID=A0A370K310_9GAMM|nr:hypothetical protein [Dyella solisilvae]RDI97065.1 hypothetical protein DVT68_18420 [Dyella solisilvae]
MLFHIPDVLTADEPMHRRPRQPVEKCVTAVYRPAACRTGVPVRTDLSATWFLNNPANDDAGDPVIGDRLGAHPAAIAAVGMILHGAGHLNGMEPMTRRRRLASSFRIQDPMREERLRRKLPEPDVSIPGLIRTNAPHTDVLRLTANHHNLPCAKSGT